MIQSKDLEGGLNSKIRWNVQEMVGTHILSSGTVSTRLSMRSVTRHISRERSHHNFVVRDNADLVSTTHRLRAQLHARHRVVHRVRCVEDVTIFLDREHLARSLSVTDSANLRLMM